MKKVVVLGCGMIGRAIAADLKTDFNVVSADANAVALADLEKAHGIETIHADFRDLTALRKLVSGFDLAVGAVPGHMGYRVLESVIDAGIPVVDISFFPEDPFGLDALARERGIPAIVDCGVAPGLCNMIAGRWHEKIKLTAYACLVGGLPLNPVPPFRYKAPFSPIDVIEEYTRPARIRVAGREVTEDALTQIENLSISPCEPLESFLTDGLRTLLTTLHNVPDMKEKTIRYPGHAAAMRVLRDSGMFGTDKIRVGDIEVAPIELTTKLLFEQWKYSPGEADFTVMRVTMRGQQGGPVEYNLYDVYDRASGTMSMARTTGYTCTAAVRLLANGAYAQTGISPPEYIGAEKKCFDFVISELEKRGVKLHFSSGGADIR